MSTEKKIKSKYQKHVSDIRLLCYILLPIILFWNYHQSVVRRHKIAQPTHSSLQHMGKWRSRIGHFRQRHSGSINFLGSKPPLLPLTRTYELLNTPPSETRNPNMIVLVRGRNISLYIVHLIHPILISFTTPLPSSATFRPSQ
jgi:hypothetical protein